MRKKRKNELQERERVNKGMQKKKKRRKKGRIGKEMKKKKKEGQFVNFWYHMRLFNSDSLRWLFYDSDCLCG